jgi:hypothetical protein
MKTISKEELSMITEFSIMQFCNACYEQGLSVEEARRIFYTKEGLETIKNAVKQYI